MIFVWRFPPMPFPLPRLTSLLFPCVFVSRSAMTSCHERGTHVSVLRGVKATTRQELLSGVQGGVPSPAASLASSTKKRYLPSRRRSTMHQDSQAWYLLGPSGFGFLGS
jgi:hypothetical protein